MGFIRFLLLISLSFCLAPPQKSSAIATIKSHSSSLGLCTDGITSSATIEESFPSRPIVTDDIQDLIIHADNTPAQEYHLRSADQWDYG